MAKRRALTKSNDSRDRSTKRRRSETSGSQDSVGDGPETQETIVLYANSMRPVEFRAQYVQAEWLRFRCTGSSQNFDISLRFAADLTGGEFNACFDLIESTSFSDYEGSSWGWHPKRKKREMKEDEMRYLLVHAPIRDGQASGHQQAPVQGFLSFMLTHDSTPSVPVLYIYEIHLEKDVRELGLGAHLMQLAEGIARNVGVKKVMLTCFLSNAKALAFYHRRGYAVDACSPEARVTRRKTVKTDYVIMSKDVPKRRCSERT